MKGGKCLLAVLIVLLIVHRSYGGTAMVGMNECGLGTDNCDDNAICIDTPGSFTCTCSVGFVGDGVTCRAVGGMQSVNGIDNGNNANGNAVQTLIGGNSGGDLGQRLLQFCASIAAIAFSQFFG